MTFEFDLDLSLPERMFQIANLHVMKNNCVKLIRNPSAIVEVMVRTNSNGRTDERTQALTHPHTPNCHCDSYVSLAASRLDKDKENQTGKMYGVNLRT